MLPSWHPHPDLWLVVFVLGFGYWFAERRLRPLMAPLSPGPTRRQWWQWYGGLVAMATVSGWPLHDIGESSLFTVHMIEHMVLSLIVPPLLLMGTPRWLADVTLGRPSVARVLRPLCRPITAFVLFNVTFIAIHWPDLVGWMLTNELIHFLVHFWLFATAVFMWMPVLSPTAAIPKIPRPAQMFYLFAQSLLPTIPASFLTFSSVPIYPVYGDASLVFGIDPVTDQTIAGIVMKLAGGLILWVTIAVIWARWTSEEREWERIESSLRTG